MPEPTPSEEPNAREAVSFESVYEEFRNLAKSQMAKEYFYSTLQGTALVHEAWLRVGGEGHENWKSRRHLFAAVTKAMQRILMERARKRKRIKHGGELTRVNEEELSEVEASGELDEKVVEINEALDRFEAFDPRKAELVRLRYFFGLSFEEAAETLGISLSTAKRWWVFARSWLHAEMSEE